MQGMIHHHSQAIVMARMAPTHDAGPALRRLAARILNSQKTEIAVMSDWLRDRGESVPEYASLAEDGEVDGRLVDVSHTLDDDATLRIITGRDDEGVELLRHSTAHLMAQAVKRLYPDTQVTIGPVIENGFYYDFARDKPFSTEDLEAIEAEMQKIVDEDITVEREVMDRDDAVKFFRDMGEEYKARIIADIPAGETISLYRQGDFIDLCRGPHVPSTGHLGAFKLMKVAGAYWRGDSNNEMLQRIYGTAWPDRKQLKAHLHRLEEAAKRWGQAVSVAGFVRYRLGETSEA